MQKVVINNYSCSSNPKDKTCSTCPITLSGECVQYKGIYLSNLDVRSGDTFNNILVKINNLINSNNGIFTMDSPTIVFQGNGTFGQPLFAQFIGEIPVPVIPTLQEVTDAGNLTTDIVTVGTLITGGGGSNPKAILGYNPAYSGIVVDAQLANGTSTNLIFLGSFVTISASGGIILGTNLTQGTTADQILVKNTTTNVVHYIDASNVIQNLQQVTDEGNITTNSINVVNTIGSSDIIAQSDSNSSVITAKSGGNHNVDLYADMGSDQVYVSSSSPGGVGMLISNSTSVGLRLMNNGGNEAYINRGGSPTNLVFKTNDVVTNTMFSNGRMSGANAVNPDEFVTLQQLPTQVNADWNATSGLAQILNKPNVILNQSLAAQTSSSAWLSGTFTASTGKFGGGPPNTFVALEVTSLPSSLNLAAIFDGRVQGNDAENNNEFVTLGQISTLYPNLQEVTDVGNITTNAIALNDLSNNVPSAGGNMLLIRHGDGEGYIEETTKPGDVLNPLNIRASRVNLNNLLKISDTPTGSYLEIEPSTSLDLVTIGSRDGSGSLRGIDFSSAVSRFDGYMVVGVLGSTPVAILEVHGSYAGQIDTRAANFTMGLQQITRITTGGITITLPTAAAAFSNGAGVIYKIRNEAAAPVNISAVLIDGVSTTSIPANTAWEIYSDGTNWRLFR